MNERLDLDKKFSPLKINIHMLVCIRNATDVKLGWNLYVVSLGKMLFTSKKVSDLRQIKPSLGLNSCQALLCVVKTTRTKKQRHCTFLLHCTFFLIYFIALFSRGMQKASAFWKNINTLANIYELLLVGHGSDSVLVGNLDRFIDLGQFTVWLGKAFVVPTLSHVYVSWSVLLALYRTFRSLLIYCAEWRFWQLKANYLDVGILKERRVRIILMFWPPNIPLHIS